ncbi:hypothetical protein I5907_10815 [Panacibacter sp. DH6]|uniref:Uncharacterized protein n=1 Tax=Panacibacter microcysteis TaxID=2793269 RepID=A0A931E7K0_9BACT|nr:hypothetical protein [Panacibacter microcysteis]MBG9376730.1 hypothetical protein [Panacibacter microcysteis]
MMIIYRILGFIVTIFSSFVAITAIVGLFMAVSNPSVLFQCFLLVSVVLYSWYANKFFAQVVLLKGVMTKKQKDWLQVNAIVAFVFSVMGIIGAWVMITQPKDFLEKFTQMPEGVAVTEDMIIKTGYFLLAVFAVLFTHIIWTYILVRKHKHQFETKA